MEKNRIVISCPNPKCQQKLSVPKTTDVLKITCPECHTSFKYPYKQSQQRKRSWIGSRIKNHPVVTGLIVTLWFINIAIWAREILSIGIMSSVLYVIWSFVCWFVDTMKEKEIKWYYRKGFVTLMLVLFPFIGITLLWAGSNFQRGLKVGLTIGFGLWLVIQAVNVPPNRLRLYESSKDRIHYMITKTKQGVFIKNADFATLRKLVNEIKYQQIPKTLKRKMRIPDIVKQYGKSVVLINSKDKDGTLRGQGSGFIIGKSGAIVTNYHVIENSYDIGVKSTDDKSYEDVSLIIAEPDIDLAIINIIGRDFHRVIMGNSNNIEVGEQVVAIGNPLGWENSVSNGIISGIRTFDGIKLLQTTTAISPGSSGGPLFNMYGEVIGITTIGSVWGAQNLNFAIPINSLSKLIDQIELSN